MKTKLITLLTLLLTVCSGAWGDTTVYSYTPTARDAAGTYDATGGKFITTKKADTSVNAIKLDFTNASDKYLKVELSSGNSLLAGDIVKITMYQTGTSSPGNNYGMGIRLTATGTAVTELTIPTANGQTSHEYSYTITSTDGLSGISEFYLGRKGGNSVYFENITITRAAAEDPVFSLTKSTIGTDETSQIQVGSKGSLDGITLTGLASSDETVATVNATGLITPLKTGSTTISFTASSAVENKYNATSITWSAVLTVTAPVVSAPTITAGGYFTTDSKTVEITKTDEESSLKYSYDNSTWSDYTAALTITETTTVYAKAVRSGYTDSEVVSATYTKFSKSDLVSVSDAKTWTIPTSLTLELKNDGTTTPAKYDEYYTYADIATINNHDLGSFDGTTLAFSGQYPYRGNNGSQNGNLQFITTVPGKVTIEFSNTGSSNKERWIKVNDTTGSEEASGTTKRTEDFTVSAGTVTITHVDKDGNLSNGLRIYSITFTPCETVKVAASGYTSLASVLDLDIANATTTTEGADALEAYVITDITKTAVTLTTVESAPAETGLILKGTANAEYTIPVSASPASITKNELSAAVEATNVGAENAYVVSGGQLMLYELAEIPAGKAYLLKSKVPTGARGLAFFFDDETTGISNVEDAQRQLLSGDFYNLAGQRVAQPAKGLYIVNGRKVVIR